MAERPPLPHISVNAPKPAPATRPLFNEPRTVRLLSGHWRQGEFIDSRRWEDMSEDWKRGRRNEELCTVWVDTGLEGVEGMGEFRGRFDGPLEARAAVIDHNRVVDERQALREQLQRMDELFGEETPRALRGEIVRSLRDIE